MSVKLRRRELKSGKVSLYLDVYHEGQRNYEFLKLYLLPGEKEHNKETLRLAENIRAKRQLEIQSNQHGFVAQFKRDADFIEYFEAIKETKNASDTAWRNTLVKLKDFTGGSLSFKGVSESWLESFKEYLLEDLAQITARTYYKKVTAALNKATKEKIIPYNPADHVDHIPKVETERTFLTEEEIRKLANASCKRIEKHPDIGRAFLFACYTGLRISDIRALKWEQLKNGRLHFRQQKTNGREYLPLSNQAKKLLGEQGTADEDVFSLPSLATIERTLKDWTEAAEIDKHVTFHVSRHTFATLALTHGVDIYTVSKLLGHKDIQTTQIYARIIDKKKEEAVNQLPELEI